jgi:hypothetical protein
MRKIYGLILMMAACLWSLDGLAGDATFVQLSRAAAKRSADDWRAEFEKMTAIGVDTIILQWTAETDIAYFVLVEDAEAPEDPVAAGVRAREEDLAPTNPSETIKEPVVLPEISAEEIYPEQYPVLERIFEAAEASGVSVVLGLHHDPNYWTEITARMRVLKDYFYVRTAHNERLQLELLKKFSHRTSWSGYYVPDEIDDLTWRTDAKLDLVAGYVALLSERLRANDADRGITISSFFRLRTAPDVYARNIKRILSGSEVTELLVQDGMGDGNPWKYAKHYVPIYYETLAEALKEEAYDRKVVIELFERVTDVGEPFRAVTAPFDRVSRQIEMAAPHFAGKVYFTYSNYMHPARGERAAELYDAMKPGSRKRAAAPAPAPAAAAVAPEDK